MTRFGKFFVNGTILTAVSLLIRGIAVSFNVYVSNTIGAEGIGLYTLITTVYGFALTLATSGINLATTRLISEELGKIGDEGSEKVRCIVQRCVLYSLMFSITTALALYAFAEPIGGHILRDIRTVASLRILALTLPPIAVSSALSGYFTAVRRVYKNAAIQVFGQIIKIFATVGLFTVLFSFNTESACIALVVGGAVSEILSFFVQWWLYAYERRNACKEKCEENYKCNVTKKLFGIALPVAFSAYVRSALITIEHILIPIGLEKSGNDKTAALASYGTVHSMVFPLVLFPSAILSSFAGLLVPEVSESNAREDKARIDRIVSRVMRAALIFSIGVAGIVGCFAYDIGNVIYPDTDAGKYIRMIAPLIPVMYIDSSVDAILKGLGEQVYCMGVNILDSALSVVLVVILLPRYGILGYIITVYFTELINATLSITRLLSLSSVKPRVFGWVGKPLISVIGATIIIKLLFSEKNIFFVSDVFMLVSYIVVSLVIYVLFLFVTGSIKPSQVKNYKLYIKNGLSR